MRTPEDAVRSVKRYVAEVLSDRTGLDWEVRLAADDAGEAVYPLAIVAAIGPMLSSRNTQVIQCTQPITVYAYPPVSESFEAAVLMSEQIRDALWMAFVGSVTPYRVPLYDYAGVPLGGGSDDREDYDHLRLVDVQVNRVPDDLDENRGIVVCDFRASWTRSTDRVAALRGGRVLQSVRQRIIVEGQQQDVPVVGIDATNETFGRPRVSKA